MFPRVFRFGLLLFVTFLFFGYFVQTFFVLAIRFGPCAFTAFMDFCDFFFVLLTRLKVFFHFFDSLCIDARVENASFLRLLLNALQAFFLVLTIEASWRRRP